MLNKVFKRVFYSGFARRVAFVLDSSVYASVGLGYWIFQTVFFDENDPAMYANLFFTLASDNPEKHLDNMQQLSVILSSEDLIAELMQVTNEEELLALAVRSGL